MIIRGATIHRDGHGECGLVPSFATVELPSFFLRPASLLKGITNPLIDISGSVSFERLCLAEPHRIGVTAGDAMMRRMEHES